MLYWEAVQVKHAVTKNAMIISFKYLAKGVVQYIVETVQGAAV